MAERDKEFVRRLDDTYLECRSIRHAWKIDHFRAVPMDDDSTKAQNYRRQYKQVLQRKMHCLRCGSERVDYFGRGDVLNLNGFTKLDSVYHYEKGYVFVTEESDKQAPRFSDYNQELFRRMSNE